MKLSIVGLGKLGAPMAAVMAHKGHNVIGVDVNPRYVADINQGRAPVSEPGLQEMISNSRARLSATENCEEAVAATDATFLIVPTPSAPDGRFSLEYVLAAAGRIGKALREKSGFHLVALSSTVMPGSVGGMLAPALEEASGKRCGWDFGLCYNPEFIALGSVIRDLLNPDMVLIGESDQRSGDILEGFYRHLCESNPRINRMNYVNAELAKLSINTFITTKISYANMLAQVCEKLPGADVDVVTAAVGCDSRIGQKNLRAALGYGGPCFPRDNVALAALARERGAPALLAEATDCVNRDQVPRLRQMILSLLPGNGTVGVLGLSYKAHTDVVEQSQALALAQGLLQEGVRVVVHDPEAMENARPHLNGRAVFAASMEECLREADVLAIMTPWPQFQHISPADLKSNGTKPVVLDCWRLLHREKFEPVAVYLTLGLGPQAAPAGEEEVDQTSQPEPVGTLQD